MNTTGQSAGSKLRGLEFRLAGKFTSLCEAREAPLATKAFAGNFTKGLKLPMDYEPYISYGLPLM